MKIEIREGPVYSEIDHPELIRDWLSYEKVYWRQGRYAKERRSFRKSLVGKNGEFLSGYVPRVKEYLEKKGHTIEVMDKVDAVPFTWPELEGITFRKDQEEAIKEILLNGRGVWKAPTGSGKTILIAAVLKAYKGTGIVLVHTKALLRQTIEELEKFGLYDDYVEVKMKQSFSNVIEDINSNYYDIVIVDEAHHVSSFDSQYAKILSYLEAPVRIGFTATTYEKEKENYLAMEGLLGPIIGETTYEDVKDELARPRMKFLKVPAMSEQKKKKLKGKYQLVYDEGIVHNRKRNQLIVEEAERNIRDGRSVLIMVEKLNHGRILEDLCGISMPGEFVFLSAEDDDEKLKKETDKFKKGIRKGVIASRIWSEGLNIKSIGCVINAVGGKSEISSIQRFGRGLRADEGKVDVLLVDMLDTNHSYFQRHSMDRLCFYSEVGWL